MLKAVASLCLWLLCAVAATAQGLGVLARVDAEASQIEDGWFGRTEVTLGLSQGVPYRVFLLDGPPRLVVDFREVNFDGLEKTDLLEQPGRITDVRFGPFQPGWSRLVADLSGPMIAEEIGLPIDENTGRAKLKISLKEVEQEAFLAAIQQEAAPELAIEAATF